MEGTIERERENGASVWRNKITKMCFSFHFTSTHSNHYVFLRYFVVWYQSCMFTSPSPPPLTLYNSLWIALEHISLYYPCTISFGGDFGHFKAFSLVRSGLMSGKAAPKTTKPAHKAAQGWLRTDRGRETDRQRDRETVVARCEMTRSLENLMTEMNVEKLPGWCQVGQFDVLRF